MLNCYVATGSPTMSSEPEPSTSGLDNKTGFT